MESNSFFSHIASAHYFHSVAFDKKRKGGEKRKQQRKSSLLLFFGTLRLCSGNRTGKVETSSLSNPPSVSIMATVASCSGRGTATTMPSSSSSSSRRFLCHCAGARPPTLPTPLAFPSATARLAPRASNASASLRSFSVTCSSSR